VRAFVLAIVLALLVAIYVTPDVGADSEYEADQRMALVAFAAACKITHYSCADLALPEVRRSPYLGRIGNRAVYLLTDVLWLDSELKTSLVPIAIFHEMVHYLQYNNGMPHERVTIIRCISEREAFDATNDYFEALGRSSEKISVKKFQDTYGC